MKVNTPVHIQLDDALEPLLAAECPVCFALVPGARLADHRKAAH